MRVRLNWGDISKDEIPAEMHIVASRIINTWRTRGIINTSIDPATNNNITQQETSSDTRTASNTKENSEDNSIESPEETASSFYLRGGEYNIFIINEQYADVPAQTGDTEQSPTPIISIENLDNYIHDNKVNVKDLYLQISSMGNEKPDIVEGNDLPDFNPDDEYLQEIKSPIFYAVQKNINIQTGQPTILDFDMQRISQRINIVFNIRTEGNIKREDLAADHLHRDEQTPHIHITLVPIVKGERKRRKREEQTKKRYRKKPTDTVRLCADDIMTRLKLKSYQDTYAEAMAKYGLQRGIDGSKARHKSTQQYYRDIQKLADDLKAEVVDLQQQKETAREELRRAKKEIQTEKLKGAATTAAANIAESVGSLFGSNKVKTLERENTALHREVADHEETIEALQDRIQTMQADHSREIREIRQEHQKEIADKEARHKQEISFLKTVIAKAAAWFPYLREMLRIEKLCRLVGFDERQTATLVSGKPLEYAGELYSEEHGRKFTTERAGVQVVKDPTDGTKLVLAINRKPIAEWFKEQFEKLRQNIRQPIQQQRKSRGMKL